MDVSLTRGTGTGGDAESDTLTAIEWLMGSAFDDVIEGESIGFGDLSVNDSNGTALVSRGFGDTVLLFGVTASEVVEDWFSFS